MKEPALPQYNFIYKNRRRARFGPQLLCPESCMYVEQELRQGGGAQKCFLEEEVAAERSKENSWQWLAPKFVSDSMHGSRCWLCLLEAPPPQHWDPIV